MIARTRLALTLSLLAAAAALGTALASEWWGGLVPCALCLVERWPYRITIFLAAIGLVLPRRLGWWCCVLIALATLSGAAAAAVHVGVERGLWPSPLPECAAPNFGGGSIADRLARMPAKPAKPCDEPTYLIEGLPVSMAEMNLLFALGFTACLAYFLWTSRTYHP